jgi:glycogen debranching enzyme
MADALRLDDQFSIVSETDRTTAPARVLKYAESFAVCDSHGDVVSATNGDHGFYHAGTRFLSRLELLLGGRRPVLLSSTISEDNAAFTADLTNPDVLRDGQVVLPRGALHLFRTRVLGDGQLVERLRISNHGLSPVHLPIAVRWDADFADVFEVRGMRRACRGQRLPGGLEADGATLRYLGLDGVERRTRVRFAPPPDRVAEGLASFSLALERHASIEIETTVTSEIDPVSNLDTRRARARRDPAPGYDEVLARHRQHVADRRADQCRVVSANESFNRWIRRSSADLAMMMTDTEYGPYPYAGIPWYSTPFGRDGLITALELLWAAPDVARGVLGFLARTQAIEIDDERDAQPGKILHEMRAGEMAALDEIPFGRYYGTADATPLFVMLAAAYFERTADRALLDRLWPHVLAALEWMDAFGDLDGDGFIEYARRGASGLVQQGWKDSFDSVFHADGTLAEPDSFDRANALSEVQAYAYAAWRGAARLASARGDSKQAALWSERAEALQAGFDTAFWCEDLGTYALALDGGKRPCRVRTSNPGHCLYAGIVPPGRARRVADSLMCDAAFAGWGIRTVASGAARYNPMSYHNGSVWPHDNALAAAGLARYGFMADAARILQALFDLSQTVDLHRLPELVCGFHRRGGDSPTLYPVACAPQAWSAGAVYLALQACVGLGVDATRRRVTLSRAALPETIEWVRLDNLQIAGASVDLVLTRHAHDVGVTVLRRQGDLEVVAVH